MFENNWKQDIYMTHFSTFLDIVSQTFFGHSLTLFLNIFSTFFDIISRHFTTLLLRHLLTLFLNFSTFYDIISRHFMTFHDISQHFTTFFISFLVHFSNASQLHKKC
eukprot:UN02949